MAPSVSTTARPLKGQDVTAVDGRSCRAHGKPADSILLNNHGFSRRERSPPGKGLGFAPACRHERHS